MVMRTLRPRNSRRVDALSWEDIAGPPRCFSHQTRRPGAAELPAKGRSRRTCNKRPAVVSRSPCVTPPSASSCARAAACSPISAACRYCETIRGTKHSDSVRQALPLHCNTGPPLNGGEFAARDCSQGSGSRRRGLHVNLQLRNDCGTLGTRSPWPPRLHPGITRKLAPNESQRGLYNCPRERPLMLGSLEWRMTISRKSSAASCGLDQRGTPSGRLAPSDRHRQTTG